MVFFGKWASRTSGDIHKGNYPKMYSSQKSYKSQTILPWKAHYKLPFKVLIPTSIKLLKMNFQENFIITFAASFSNYLQYCTSFIKAQGLICILCKRILRNLISIKIHIINIIIFIKLCMSYWVLWMKISWENSFVILIAFSGLFTEVFMGFRGQLSVLYVFKKFQDKFMIGKLLNFDIFFQLQISEKYIFFLFSNS